MDTGEMKLRSEVRAAKANEGIVGLQEIVNELVAENLKFRAELAALKSAPAAGVTGEWIDPASGARPQDGEIVECQFDPGLPHYTYFCRFRGGKFINGGGPDANVYEPKNVRCYRHVTAPAAPQPQGRSVEAWALFNRGHIKPYHLDISDPVKSGWHQGNGLDCIQGRFVWDDPPPEPENPTSTEKLRQVANWFKIEQGRTKGEQVQRFGDEEVVNDLLAFADELDRLRTAEK